MRAWFHQLFSGLENEGRLTLQVRLFRLFCATTAILSLAVILPANLVQNLPFGVHLADVALGLTAAWCYRASKRGRHHIIGFFVVLVLLFDPAWFLNAGSEGSVPYYFFPLLLYPLAICEGRWRWGLGLFLILNLCGLLLVEYYFPGLRVPFKTPMDRLIDLVSGAICALAALGVLIWLIVAAHEQEERRITDYAKKLAAGEENYRAIFNGTSDAMGIYDETGRLLDANAHMCAMYGCDLEELRRQPISARSLGVSPYGAVEARESMRRAMEGGPQVFRWRSRRSNGELFWSEIAVRAADIAGQRRVISALRDISQRIAIEDELRMQEERLRVALAASDQGWFDLNLVTGEGIASGEYARIIGLEPVEFRVTASSWLDGIHPEDRAAVAREFQACVGAGVTSTVEYRRLTASGAWKWIRSTGRIVQRDAEGRASRMSGTHADINERKKMEIKLLHSQRLESVGTLAGGVAHDLNNILTPMLMVSAVLREKLADPEDRELMMQMEAGAKRGAGIVRQLLTFSRDLIPARASVDVAQLIGEMMAMMRGTFPREIELTARLPDGLWPVTADPIQLHQVLLNLCINARDAMPAGGRLTLEVENLPLAVDGPARVAAASRQRMVAITVSDTGEGILPEHMVRIFDPFFSTKGVGKGTGLGLSTVHGIVKSHGGAVTVESEPGRGSRFRVTLPASDTAPLPLNVAVEIPRRSGRRPVVMVIDDEPSVLEMSARVLEKEGCEVVAALGSDSALRLIPSLAGTVKLVITDMMMPGIDGPTLVPLLRKYCPDLKVIGVSGLDLDPRKPELRALGFVDMLRKPYDAATLQAAVRRQLPDAGEPTADGMPMSTR